MKTNLKGLKEDLKKNDAVLPAHWDTTVIQITQGELDYLENQIALLYNLLMRLESKVK